MQIPASDGGRAAAQTQKIGGDLVVAAHGPCFGSDNQRFGQAGQGECRSSSQASLFSTSKLVPEDLDGCYTCYVPEKRFPDFCRDPRRDMKFEATF